MTWTLPLCELRVREELNWVIVGHIINLTICASQVRRFRRPMRQISNSRPFPRWTT